jgi:hypothetical protein
MKWFGWFRKKEPHYIGVSVKEVSLREGIIQATPKVLEVNGVDLMANLEDPRQVQSRKCQALRREEGS